ncbi:hypothetical protein HZH68_001886 [Vespula germanica]|uniref:Elongation of very long chain fatty acids protein n=1 Tax=Vespula germanica TaxID=30212 RepID=A0A834KWU7_VESGE|nr:hypothetical protein HZH68_001886 [Vespula germanica]
MASAAAELVAERELEPMREMVDGNRTTFVGAQGLVKLALEQYTEILASASDPRVGSWPLMESPIPTVVIVLLYLYSVTIAGPRVMSNKKPYDLRNVLIAYNAFQVVFSLGMLYEVIDKSLTWTIDPVQRSRVFKPEAPLIFSILTGFLRLLVLLVVDRSIVDSCVETQAALLFLL